LSVALSPAQRDPAWVGRVFWLATALVLLWPMMVLTEFKPWILLDAQALKPSLTFLAGFLHPRLDLEFLQLMAKETWRTVAIATCGIALALVLAVPLSLLATRSLSVSALSGTMGFFPAAVRQAVRVLLIGLRSIPELVWALVFVRVVGLGPTSGVLAIALAYGGMLGKVYCEILESGESLATRSLLHNGAGRLQAFFYGLMPQNAAELTSYTVYRWECAIRSSAVLGFVGAGGVGQQLDTSMKMFAANEVCSLLLVFVMLVWLADQVSSWLRKALA
jgi:phosphonate transport system permease protein